MDIKLFFIFVAKIQRFSELNLNTASSIFGSHCKKCNSAICRSIFLGWKGKIIQLQIFCSCISKFNFSICRGSVRIGCLESSCHRLSRKHGNRVCYHGEIKSFWIGIRNRNFFLNRKISGLFDRYRIRSVCKINTKGSIWLCCRLFLAASLLKGNLYALDSSSSRLYTSL